MSLFEYSLSLILFYNYSDNLPKGLSRVHEFVVDNYVFVTAIYTYVRNVPA